MQELLQGFNTMIIGMGVVFSFLIIMVFVMVITSFIIGKINIIFPEKEETAESGLKKIVEGDDDIAVVLAAVETYMKKL